MRYNNRTDAALTLIPYLDKYKNDESVVLAVPRGGVPIACHIARYYHFPLELLMIKKIGHPTNPEFAIGAVSLEDSIADERPDVPRSYIDEQVKKIRKNLGERYQFFMGDHIPIDFRGKTLIIADDGIATGNTLLSSINMLRKHRPAKIVIAVPVSSRQAAQRLRIEVDDFVCPYLPGDFVGVGYHYRDFSEVTDQEVIRLLKERNHYKKFM